MEPLLTDDEARKAQEAQQGLDAASPQHDPVAAAAVDAIHQGRELLQVFGPAFARSRFFWKSALLAVVEGVVMGLLALVFFNGFEQGSKLWLTEDYDVRVANGDVGFGHGGKAWWPLLTTAAGLVVGLISLVPWYPKHVHGLFAEVRDLYANPWAAPWAVLVSCISLAAGASVGPEAAMGMLGAALGTALGAVLGEMPERRVHTSALTGMAGGMGALFPTPLLAVLLLHELGATARADEAWWIAAEEVAHGGASSLNGDSADAASEFSGAIGASGGSEHFMETIVLMGVAACSSWTVFYALKDRTFLESSTVKLAGYDAHAYKTWHMGAAIVLGFIGGVMGILGAIFMGIFKKVFTGVKARLKQRRWRVLAAVVPPMIGGAIYGAIAVALPLTLGDGASQLPNAIAQVPRDAVALAFLSLSRALSFSHAHSLRELGRLRQIALHVAPLGRQRDRRDGRR